MIDPNNPAPKRRGCFFYGCLTLLVVGLAGGVAIYFGLRAALAKANALVAEYTDTAPMILERLQLPPAEREALERRVAAFKQALENGTSAQELILSAYDLNALIEDNRDLKGKVFVMIETNRLKGHVSIPLSDIGPLKLKGRYLNGTAAFQVALRNGVLAVELDTLEVRGKPLPDALLLQLKRQNLARDIYNNPKAAENIRRFESIEIRDDQVVLKNRVQR